MAQRLLPPDWRMLKDDGTGPVTDGTLSIRVAGTSTATACWYDKELTQPTTAGVSSISCDTYGWPAASGNEVALWGADDVTYDIVAQGTGYNGGASRTLEDVAVAETTAADETSSELALGNAIPNGAFEACSGATSGSALSGDGDGDETVDGWYFTQPAAASNEWSQQDGFAIGADPVEARKSIRFGRPSSSTSTNELRLWVILKPSECWRLRGKEVTLRFSAKAGANFSSSGAALGVRLATGTAESEDGDNIDAGTFTGHVNAIDQAQAISATAARFEYTVTLGATIKEIGIQFSFTGVGTAGANDWVQIQDVELKETTASEEFAALPEVLEFLRVKTSTLGREFIAFAASAPGADRGVFWDHSALDFVFWTSSDLAFSGTALNLAATPTDGNFLVGDGAGWIAESGATARTSLGVGAGDDVTFASVTVTGILSAPDGAANAPSVKVGNEQNGLYSSAANTLAITAGGAVKIAIGTNLNLSSAGQVQLAAGTVGAPAIIIRLADTGTGFYSIGTNNIGAAANGALVYSYDSTGIKDASGNILKSTGKTTVPIPASAMLPNTTNGAAGGLTETSSNKVMVQTFDFDATTQEAAQFCIPMPKSWNEGTVTFQPIWTASAGTPGDTVVWDCAGVALSNDDALDTAFGTEQSSSDVLLATGDVHIGPESSAITIGNSPAEGDMVVFRVRRVPASDNLPNDAKLIAIKVHLSLNAGNDT